MTHGSLFSGIGGFDLAAECAGFENIFQVEINEFCQQILKKNFPNVKRYADIKEFDGTKYRGSIDVISGGFPCQPFSNAGKRKGKEDDRAIWCEMFRIITEIKPEYIICENVVGIVTMELDKVLFDLESEGYKTETYIIPAVSLNAPHKRDRVWIIAYTDGDAVCNNKRKISNSSKEIESKAQRKNRKRLRTESCSILGNVTDTNKVGCKQYNKREKWSRRRVSIWNGETSWIEVATELCGVDDGISNRVDRLKGLGNAIVPQIAQIFFEIIINKKS